MATQSSYSHSLWQHDGHDLIIIEDLNESGKKSVTNDIDNVIDEIATREKINPVQYHIIYKDSQGIWDGYNFSTRQFIPLQAHSWEKAIAKLFSLLSLTPKKEKA